MYPPLGLWYLAAQLEAQGHTTDFRDLSNSELPTDGEYDQVWISATSPQMHEVRRIGEITKHWTQTATVFGGAAAWARPDECQHLPFDLVVSGESDHPQTVKMMVARAGDNSRWKHETIDRLFTPAITIGPLDWVLPPIRRWDGQYHSTLTDRSGAVRSSSTMFTSRGCPMACAFCESGRNGVIWDRVVRYEPLSTIDIQLREIVERGHSAVMFYDDILPLNKPRTLALMQLLKQYGLIWRCFLRTDIICKQGGFDYLQQLSDGGLVEVLAGVESADNRIKANVHKGTTIEQDTDVLSWCKELGIKFKASFILGLPGEDRDSLERTRQWILAMRPDRVDVNTLIPFPGTPLTSGRADYLGVEYDVKWEEELPEQWWYKGAREHNQSIVSTSALSAAEITEFRDNLMKEIEEAGIPY